MTHSFHEFLPELIAVGSTLVVIGVAALYCVVKTRQERHEKLRKQKWLERIRQQ